MFTKVVSRSTVFATIVALALASISATSVFAAGLAHRDSQIRSTDQNLVSDWKSELAALQAAKIMDNSIGKRSSEWMETKRSTSDIQQKDRFAAKAAIDLRAAEILAGTHPGFSTTGKVTDRALANKTIQDLMLDLHNFHMDMTDKLGLLFS